MHSAQCYQSKQGCNVTGEKLTTETHVCIRKDSRYILTRWTSPAIDITLGIQLGTVCPALETVQVIDVIAV